MCILNFAGKTVSFQPQLLLKQQQQKKKSERERKPFPGVAECSLLTQITALDSLSPNR